MSGMAAAYDLKRAGFRTTVFEARDRVGGRMWSIRKGDFLMDLGASIYLKSYPHTMALIHEIGLSADLVERPAIGAMIRDGRGHHLDYTTPIRTGLRTDVLSRRAKIKLAKFGRDVVRHRRALGYATYDEMAEIDTETVVGYCRRELGEELFRYLGSPLVSGTWVADPMDTSVALLHWTVRNMMVSSVLNLRSGVSALPEELATHVDVRFRHEVANVADNGSRVEVTCVVDGAEQTEFFDACVIATTAQSALAMYPQMDDNTRDLYASTRYRRLGTVCLGLSERPANPATYCLMPPFEDPDTVMLVADHNKAEGRVPEGKGLITVMLSQHYLDRTDDRPDGDLLDFAVDRASRYYGTRIGDLLQEHALMRWPESVPTMERGRFARIAGYHRRIDRSARVQFASDLDRVAGIDGATASGRDAAARVCARFAAPLPAATG